MEGQILQLRICFWKRSFGRSLEQTRRSGPICESYTYACTHQKACSTLSMSLPVCLHVKNTHACMHAQKESMLSNSSDPTNARLQRDSYTEGKRERETFIHYLSCKHIQTRIQMYMNTPICIHTLKLTCIVFSPHATAIQSIYIHTHTHLYA